MAYQQYFGQEPSLNDNEGDKSWMTTMILALLLGEFGVHRFYTGYIWIGVAQLILTLTGIGGIISGIWLLVDLVSIARNTYQDAEGRDLVGENPGCGMIVLILIGLSVIFCIIALIMAASTLVPHY